MIVLNGGYYRLTIFRYIHCVLMFSMNMNVKMMTMLNKNMFCILSISIKNKPYIQNKKCLNFSLRVRLPQGGVTFPLWKSDPGVNLPRGSVFDVTHHLLVLSSGCRLVATRGGGCLCSQPCSLDPFKVSGQVSPKQDTRTSRPLTPTCGFTHTICEYSLCNACWLFVYLYVRGRTFWYYIEPCCIESGLIGLKGHRQFPKLTSYHQ